MTDPIPIPVPPAPPWPLFVSFWTPNYAEHAAGLVASLEAHGLPHNVVPLDDAGSWSANQARKAAFCYAQLAERRGQPIVWLDADARVRNLPDRFLDMAEREVNIAARWRDGQELLSGTLYLAGSLGLALCRAWVVACESDPARWDQRSLAAVLHMVPGLRIEVLPAEYTFIAEFDRHIVEPGEEVVEHLQHSREIRRQEAGRG